MAVADLTAVMVEYAGMVYIAIGSDKSSGFFFTCSKCNNSYEVETRKNLSTRMNDHKSPTRTHKNLPLPVNIHIKSLLICCNVCMLLYKSYNTMSSWKLAY